MKKHLIVLMLIGITLLLFGCGNKAEEYEEGIKETSEEILKNSANAEEILDMYSSVWAFSIESNSSISVDEMSVRTGIDVSDIKEHFEASNGDRVSGDFSTNVQSLVSYYTATGKLEKIEKTSKEIKEKITELNDPPSEYENAYDEILDMYTSSEEYIDLASNPTGSLETFNESTSQLSSDILSKYKRIEAILPSGDND